MHFDTFIQQVLDAGWHLDGVDTAIVCMGPQPGRHSTAKLTHLGHTALVKFPTADKLIATTRIITDDGTITDLDNAEAAAIAMTRIGHTPRAGIDHIADRIAAAAYAGLTDGAGPKHINRLRRIAQIVQPNTADYRATALLHDILTNTSVTEDNLALQGIPARIIAAVTLLRRDPQTSDDHYYAAIRRDTIALAVKLAEIADATDPTRLAALAPAARQRLTGRYAQARATLLGQRPGARSW